MRAFGALIWREYLEHRAPFFYVPAALLGLFTLAILSALAGGRLGYIESGGLPGNKLFELGFAGAGVLWWYYLLTTLFFYCADAFSADRRNNAMFFWKSMPQSDLKILWSKMGAALSLFPLIIFAAFILSGLLIYGFSFVAVSVLPGLSSPEPGSVLASWFGMGLMGLCYLVVGLLWYSPFLAWVGALSTVFRRWSMPLSILIPLLAILFENLVFFGAGPSGGYIYSFLSQRLAFPLPGSEVQAMLFTFGPIDWVARITGMLQALDWVSLLGGVVFAVLAVGAASAYRRRRLAS